MKTMTISGTEEKIENIRFWAKKDNRPISYFVILACEEYAEKQKLMKRLKK